jgi:hypothetical protein
VITFEQWAADLTAGWWHMTLSPSDMLAIQSAIDRYERRFPDKPSPTAAEALAWRSGTPWDRLLIWWRVVVMPRMKPAAHEASLVSQTSAGQVRDVSLPG